MKIITYISLLDYYNEDGVSKKIKSQILSFKKLGYRVYFTYLDKEKDKYFLNMEDRNIELFRDKKSVLLNTIYLYIHLGKILQANKTNYIYIRHTLTHLVQFLFLKRMHKRGIINIIEIPTYPYADEYKRKMDKILLTQDYILNNKIQKYVNYIVTYSLDKYIFNIPCINISNGIDLNKSFDFETRYKRDKDKDIISFTSVSTCYYWHGIDRFLKSLRNYIDTNPETQVIFNIVGEGSETESLKSYVKENNLEQNVVFYGFQSGNDLDDIYRTTDIAVGSLGRHRSGIYTMRALKNVEYASKGLPMIFSENDPGFFEAEFVYKVEANEDSFDIAHILKWYKSNNTSPKEITNYCTQFSWESQMRTVSKVLEGDEMNAYGNCTPMS